MKKAKIIDKVSTAKILIAQLKNCNKDCIPTEILLIDALLTDTLVLLTERRHDNEDAPKGN